MVVQVPSESFVKIRLSTNGTDERVETPKELLISRHKHKLLINIPKAKAISALKRGRKINCFFCVKMSIASTLLPMDKRLMFRKG